MGESGVDGDVRALRCGKAGFIRTRKVRSASGGRNWRAVLRPSQREVGGEVKLLFISLRRGLRMRRLQRGLARQRTGIRHEVLIGPWQPNADGVLDSARSLSGTRGRRDNYYSPIIFALYN